MKQGIKKHDMNIERGAINNKSKDENKRDENESL